MNFFKSTFYNKYTPLTREQIAAKLKPAPAARSASPLSEALSGKSLKIRLDKGPTLEYKFKSKDKLSFSENGSTAVMAPYAARELVDIFLLKHMIPDSL